jgi:hypothetical protein
VVIVRVWLDNCCNVAKDNLCDRHTEEKVMVGAAAMGSRLILVVMEPDRDFRQFPRQNLEGAMDWRNTIANQAQAVRNSRDIITSDGLREKPLRSCS